MKGKIYKDNATEQELPGEREIPEKPNEPPFIKPFEPEIFPEELPVIDPPEKRPDSIPPETPILPPK